MPHTSHRKKKGNHNKRKEILDEDGWTRVTSTAHASTATSSLTTNGTDVASGADHRPLQVAPMPPKKDSTLESMRAQYDKVEAKWLETELCTVLEHVLKGKVLTNGRKVSNCVVLGTGSFCGDAVHWIDRHESAYHQLAAFKTVVKTIEVVQGQSVPAYAQEPYYNDLDVALLADLNISKVDHPQGFELLEEHSFAYSPAAEPEVEVQIMSRNPGAWLHRSLHHLIEGDKEVETSRKMAEGFRKTHADAKLPALDLKNLPFHGLVIWWTKEDDP